MSKPYARRSATSTATSPKTPTLQRVNEPKGFKNRRHLDIEPLKFAEPPRLGAQATEQCVSANPTADDFIDALEIA